MTKNRLPLHGWIRRKAPVESIQVRIDEKLKVRTILAAKKLETSLNRLVEAALDWYLDKMNQK